MAAKKNPESETFTHEKYGERDFTNPADKVQARTDGWLPKGEKRNPIPSNLPSTKGKQQESPQASPAPKPDASK